ncbi:MAG: hypothetical protein GY896_14160 [Gammaproteobacteria bacterium]|nr:hypothetical protein [Gammaproteobacteria bacterium]
MFALLNGNFLGVSRDVFEADLQAKNRVILFRENELLLGFSTFLYYITRYQGKNLGIVYSGDTIIAPDAWGSFHLPRTWIREVRRIGATHDIDRQYWLLIVSGFRTYRFLPIFWKSFFPRYDQPTPGHMQKLLEHLATERFGDCFEASTGTVNFPQPQVLRNSLSIVPASRVNNPHIEFFERANPGWKRGDELVCLTEISDTNLTSAGKRMVFSRGASYSESKAGTG